MYYKATKHVKWPVITMERSNTQCWYALNKIVINVFYLLSTNNIDD